MVLSKSDDLSDRVPFLSITIPSSSAIYTSSSHRSTLRMREKYILFLIIATFVVFFVGGFFFLPELKAGTKYAYSQFKGIGPDLTGIIPPVKERSHRPDVDDPQRMVIPAPDYVKHVEPRPGRMSDMQRLAEKIRAEMNISQIHAVLPTPYLESQQKPTGASLISWTPLIIPSGEPVSDLQTVQRRNTVKAMMKHAWDNYVEFAWGENELRSISPEGPKGHSPSIFGRTKLGASIIDAMDTLYLMGMKDEFNKGKKWIQDNLSLDGVNADISVFEFNIRFIGGLLSCYALTKDEMFLTKAESVAQKLLPAFDTPTGIPYALINPSTGYAKNYAWASSSASILSEVGSLHLEFLYLSEMTGNPVYKEKVFALRDTLDKISKPNGLYPNYINPKTGVWGQHHMSMGALGDSFYEYLLKTYLQSGETDTTAKRMYDEAMDAVIRHLLKTSQQSHLKYLADMKYDRMEHKMDHLACFAGGLFALGSRTFTDELKRKEHMDIGAGITNTCHESYNRSATGIGPESFRFTESFEAEAVRLNEKYYILRPEVFEAYFVLWRLTKDQRYREWAWEAVQALEKYCRVEHGYTGLKNVYKVNGPKDGVQQSFLFAETLKYLYLIFSDDDLLPFDYWVLNTEAHPLPIKGKNPAYPANN